MPAVFSKAGQYYYLVFSAEDLWGPLVALAVGVVGALYYLLTRNSSREKELRDFEW